MADVNIVSIGNGTSRDAILLLVDKATKSYAILPFGQGVIHGLHKSFLDDAMLVVVDDQKAAEEMVERSAKGFKKLDLQEKGDRGGE